MHDKWLDPQDPPPLPTSFYNLLINGLNDLDNILSIIGPSITLSLK